MGNDWNSHHMTPGEYFKTDTLQNENSKQKNLNGVSHIEKFSPQNFAIKSFWSIQLFIHSQIDNWTLPIFAWVE